MFTHFDLRIFFKWIGKKPPTSYDQPLFGKKHPVLITLPETNSSPMEIPPSFLVNAIKIRWIFHGYVSLQE